MAQKKTTQRKTVDMINAQIGMELAASQKYLAMALFLHGRSLDHLAAFFHKQSDEERGHAMKFVHYLQEIGATPLIPALAAPQASYDSVRAVLAASLAGEQAVTASIHGILQAAIAGGDHRTVQFLQWFVGEQIEEEATFSRMLDIEKLAHNELQFEMYVRQMGAAG